MPSTDPAAADAASAPAVLAETAATPLRVACFCARWCRLCGDYRAVFESVLAEQGLADRGAWIDIEDDEAVLGAIEVDDFPTLLIARGTVPVFFGPLTPQPGTLSRLLRGAQADALGRLDDAEVVALLDRVDAWRPARHAGEAATPPG